MGKVTRKFSVVQAAAFAAAAVLILMLGACSPAAAVVVDNTPPVFDSGPTATPAGWTNGGLITISWTASDLPSSDGLTAEYRIDSTSDLDYTPNDSPVVLDVAALGLAQGKHTVDVRLTDAVGNQTTKSVDVYVDTIAPNAFTPTANPSGWSKGPIRIAFDTTDPGASSEPQTGSGVDRYNVSVDGVGDYGDQLSPFDLDVSTYPTGTYTVHVTAEDSAGNERTENLVIQVDNTAPAAFNAVPDTGNWSKTSVGVTFGTTDPLPGSGVIDHYEVSLDGGPYSPQASPYAVPTEGAHTVRVRAFDGAKPDANVRDCSSPAYVLIDKTAPHLNSCHSWGDSTAGNIPVDFTASDPMSGIKKTHLWYKKGSGGVWTDSGLSSSATSGTFYFEGTGDGTYYFGFVIEDQAGNTASSNTGDGNCNTTLDTEVPTFNDITAEPHYAKVGDTVTIKLTASEELMDAPYVSVGSDDAILVSAEGQEYTFSYTVLPGTAEGPADIYIEGIDNSFNYNWTDVYDQLTIDNTPPQDFTPVPSPAGWTNSTSASVTFEATDAQSGIDYYEIAVDDGDYSPDVSPCSVDTTGLADGVHKVHVKAVDLAGNERIKDATILIDKTPPLAFVPVSNPGSWTHASTAQISWSTTDAASGIDHYEIAFGNGPYVTHASPYTLDVSGLATGLYVVHVKAVDAVGNWTVGDVTSQVLTDTAPPIVSMAITDPSPSLGRQFDYVLWKNWMGVTTAAQNTYNVSWTASDSDTGVASVRIEYRPSAAAPWTTLATSTSATGAYSFDVSSWPESDSYAFRITATDGSGNSAVQVTDPYGVYDAKKLIPTAQVLSPVDCCYLVLGATAKIKVQELMPVFDDPRAAGRAYKQSSPDWWFKNHALTASPKLQEYRKRNDGRPTSLRKTLLSSIARQTPQFVANPNSAQVSGFRGRLLVNTWETDYLLKKNVVDTSDAYQAEMKYSDIVSIGNQCQPDKPNKDGQVLPTTRTEPLVNQLKQCEYNRFWLKKK